MILQSLEVTDITGEVHVFTPFPFEGMSIVPLTSTFSIICDNKLNTHVFVYMSEEEIWAKAEEREPVKRKDFIFLFPKKYEFLDI
ncbi:hypothetical protein LCGC14_1451380 [marine sediment metagenome]|uniref:Uncharacterized protein n=1 Tax=marine sediment metagenome TaxID=412755 RepID=A0A0F9JIH2_9ZZZZ